MNYGEKKSHILTTAENLFAHKGFTGTSVRDIADEAGVNLAMISYYFGSKEKLMQSIIEQRTTQLRVRSESLLSDESVTPIEKVYALIDDFVERIMQKEQFYKIIICEQLQQKNVAITDMISDLKKQSIEVLGKIIQDGQKKKAFKKGVDVLLAHNTMNGVILQTFINKEYYKHYYKLQHLSEEEFKRVLKEKLSIHIKDLFKSMLVYEV